MSLIQKFRKIHRQTAPIVFIPLFVSALTGIAYGLFTNWFGLSEEEGEIFLVIHQGEYLGDQLKPIYVTLVGLGLLGMIVTGLIMSPLLNKNLRAKVTKKLDQRQFHSFLAPIIFLPLIVSIVTGICYRLGKSYFGLSSEQAEIFMVIHQGEYLGDFLKPIYVLLVGLGLVAMLVTGIRMTPIFRQRRQQKDSSE